MDTNILKGSSEEYFPTLASNGYATMLDMERTLVEDTIIRPSVQYSLPINYTLPEQSSDPYHPAENVVVSADYLRAIETLAAGMLQLLPYEELLNSSDITWDTFLKLIDLRGHRQ